MARERGNKPAQTVDQEQQAYQGQSMGSKMIHLPVALFKAMMHHGQKQMSQDDQMNELDDPQQMPMTPAPAPQPGLAPVQYGPPQ